MDRATRINPHGLRGYDHTAYRHLPAYIRAAHAIAGLQQALRDQHPGMAVNDFHHLLADLSAGRRILDSCPECPAGPHLPYRVEHDDRGTVGHYECGCGHQWFTSWSITAPISLRDAA